METRRCRAQIAGVDRFGTEAECNSVLRTTLAQPFPGMWPDQATLAAAKRNALLIYTITPFHGLGAARFVQVQAINRAYTWPARGTMGICDQSLAGLVAAISPD